MEFCRFYGVSLPQLILAGVNENTITHLASYLNNSFDAEKLKDFKRELEALVGFFDRIRDKKLYAIEPDKYSSEKEKAEYKLFIQRKKYIDAHERRLKASKSTTGINTRTRKFGRPEPPKPAQSEANNKDILPDDIYQELKRFIRYNNVRLLPTESRSGETYLQIQNLNNSIETLNELEITICEFFGDKIKLREHLISKLDDIKDTTATVFNIPISTVLSSNGEKLLNFLYGRCKKENAQSDNFYFTLYKELEDFYKLVFEEEEGNNNEIELTEISYEKSQQGYEHEKFIESVRKLNPILAKNEEALYYVSELYLSLVRVDEDLCQNNFRLEEGKYTKADYEKAFSHLAQLGLVGLGFNSVDMLKDAIKDISFSIDNRIFVAEDSECATNINLSKRFADTIIMREGDNMSGGVS